MITMVAFSLEPARAPGTRNRAVAPHDVMLHIVARGTLADQRFSATQLELIDAAAVQRERIEALGVRMSVHRTSIGRISIELERALLLMRGHEIVVRRPTFIVQLHGGPEEAQEHLAEMSRELGPLAMQALEEITEEAHKVINANRGNILRQQQPDSR